MSDLGKWLRRSAAAPGRFDRAFESLDEAPVHRLEPCAGLCALLLVAWLGQADARTPRWHSASHGEWTLDGN